MARGIVGPGLCHYLRGLGGVLALLPLRRRDRPRERPDGSTPAARLFAGPRPEATQNSPKVTQGRSSAAPWVAYPRLGRNQPAAIG